MVIIIMSINNKKGGGEKVVEECVRILKQQSVQGTQKWLSDSKISSLALRNVKAVEVISLSNYMLHKMLISQTDKQYQLLNLLVDYHKRNTGKCHEYARLVKHFSKWDYQFQYLYWVTLNQQLDQLGLYLRVRETVMHSDLNRGKKELLSGVTAQLQQWASMARIIFKTKEEEDVIDQFTTVVRQHYIQIKKSQSQKVNGAEFLRVCQIIDHADSGSVHSAPPPNEPSASKQQKIGETVNSIFEQTVLNGLSTQDRELIRVLSYKDKNIARMLQEKHTKMVHMIGQEVNSLRKDINREKERYVEVVEEKNVLIRLIQRLKDSALKYIMDRNESSQFELLQLLDGYNKKYNPKALDVAKTTDVINNRRLIEIIQKEELEVDQI